ncbi:tRNA pseudouridine synthase 1 [Pseudogymnoascus australis]
MTDIGDDKQQILDKMADQNKSTGEASLPTNSKPVDDRDRHGKDRKRGNNGGREFGRGKGRGGNNHGSHGSRQPKTEKVDKRKRNEEEQESKRRKIAEFGEGAVPESPFSKEEIAAEERRPKRKVAVLIGYAGSGYKGMQINTTEKTIEGDLFSAFVTAGAISKANADDPKKSSLVRCARTDKGVHAAGNVISLKLIIDEEGIVEKINAALPPQIRVWGIERTNASFSCYQTCDSRWYEYLIPTHSFLPPHPQSYLAKKLVDSATTEGNLESYNSRQEEVAGFWAETEEKYIKPILEKLDPALRSSVMAAIHTEDVVENPDEEKDLSGESVVPALNGKPESDQIKESTTADSAADTETSPETTDDKKELPATAAAAGEKTPKPLTPLEAAIKEVKAAYIKAKKAYRISDTRRDRVQEALSAYLGTKNFHNYTIQKSFKEDSAKRVIRSFTVNPEPVYVNDTEWLSLKVHGQSFMMHQIRKMVAMAALVVRCGTPIERINESYQNHKISIPKAPGLGLLLERPVFDSYNKRAVEDLQREKIDFTKYEAQINEFKQREIYERIYREEEKENQFHTFFHHIDHYRSEYFLWVMSTGISAARQALGKGEVPSRADEAVGLGSEDEGGNGAEEG